MTLAMMANHAIAQTCPLGASVNKWQVLNALRIAAPALGVSRRRIGLLAALLSFHPGADLVVGQNLTVFPSNASLSRRADVSESTVTRGLLDLVLAGLIIRRDSRNCKRFPMKGEGGEIKEAFGFDLTLLVARADEFQRIAAFVEQEREELKHLRLSISINQREIRKMLEIAMTEQLPGDWGAFEAAYAPLSARMPRSIPLREAAILASALDELAAEVRNLMTEHIEIYKMSSNAPQNAQHIQNSNPNPITELEPGQPVSQGQTKKPDPQTPRPPQRSYPLGMVLDACPDIATYAPNGISSWRDFVATAAVVRPFLGISPSAWEDAKDVLGPEDAAVLVAAILQRTDAINSAGGYLRSLTEKARAGAFSLGPVLMALIRSNLGSPGRKRA
ncbi:plasmid replication protein RepC (plasmid) [Methylocapsa polymorpha]|uniref:Plasmid replication protein RepC n=1 Tax=Methylocapsa polymorpha TaxID=3080828 RepID=A0ABZ0HY40_9HYPH|nr:plasmid replication protein RepC [Methylocapsa sp. RX1]